MQKRQTATVKSPIIWLKDAWYLAKPYWQSEERKKSLGLLTLIIAFNLVAIAMNVLINKWYNGFYDILQTYNKNAFFGSIVKFCLIAFFYITARVLSSYVLKFLEIRWRIWLTKYYLANWLNYKAYYKTRFLQVISDNPDQRISEDINSFIILFLQVSLGFINSLVTLISFVGILWSLSGILKLHIGGHSFNLHGYMVWVALVYAIVGTYIMFKLGKPLIKLNFDQQAYEADFRYGLIRIRDNAEPIAFYNGEQEENKTLLIRFNNVVDNFVKIIYRNLKLDTYSSGYGQISILFPFVVNAPRYFAKTIKLGDMMQISSAFGQVQGALSYFINAYTALAGGRAVMDRLAGFQQAIEQADALPSLPVKSGNNYLQLNNVTINLPNQEPLIKNLSFNVNSGEQLLIRGRSGSGKTTLLRVIADIWGYANGEIKQKEDLKRLFVPQKPYLLIGSLREAVCYPKTANLPSNAELAKLFELCELGKLINYLEENTNWTDILSLGEQQKLAFCRILINKPDIICLDEATSAMDEETEAHLYQTLIKRLPQSAIISVGHRSTIKKWHHQELIIGN